MRKPCKPMALVGALALFAAACALAAQAIPTPRTDVATSVVTAGEAVEAGRVVGAAGGYGYAYGAGSSNLVVLGIAQNTAASNGVLVVRGSGVYGLRNNGAVTAAHIGRTAYAATNDAGRAVAPSGAAAVGTIVNVDADHVWVRLGL
ncbi:MAG: hypothetical protein ACOX9C_04415 [Kiritimatiellia bacterium]|jgi:hypothetical protein